MLHPLDLSCLALPRLRSQRLAVLGLSALTLTTFTWMPVGAEAASASSAARAVSGCGSGGSWSVKIGTDSQARQVNLGAAPTHVTVAQLTSKPLPSPINHRVKPTETTVYVFTAKLTAIHTEHDRDLHLVVNDSSGHHMITEVPDPACVPASSPFRPGIVRARNQLKAWSGHPPATVEFTGVGFFDGFTGQSDQAPNQIELHPILNLKFK